MSAVSYAINTIFQKIPQDIISKTLQACGGFTATTLEGFIKQKIFMARIFPDIRVVGGEHVYLPVVDATVISQSSLHVALFYSDEYLMGREIVSVHALHNAMIGYTNLQANAVLGSSYNSAMPTSLNTKAPCPEQQFNPQQSAMLDAMISRMHEGTVPLNHNVNTQVQVIAKNTVLARYVGTQTLLGQLEVVITDDPELNNLSIRSHNYFAELCVLATKAFIYNTMVTRLGYAAIQSGQDMSQINSIVEGYSSAEEDYTRFLREDWSAISVMNDTQHYGQLLKIGLNPF